MGMKQEGVLKLGLFFLFWTVISHAGVSGKNKYNSYLFAYFSSNSPDGEQVRYAVSEDGFNYKALNAGRPVIASEDIALTKSIRDPHILRAEDGKTFYMVLTDMRSSLGWQSNDGLILMKSTDLINWQHTTIDFPSRFPGLHGFDRKNLHAVWAPQTIWDPKEQKYMIYYSIGRHDWEYPVGERFQPYFKLYYSYANEDFTDITEPKLLFDFGTASIDGDIVYDAKNQEYILFFKDEGLPTINNGFKTNNGVMRATGKNLTGPYTVEYRHVHGTNEFPVEGSSVFPLVRSDEYVLMYDCYAKGYYQFCKSKDLKNFVFVQNTETKGDFTPRHGSVIRITKKERERLETWSELNLTIIASQILPMSVYLREDTDVRMDVRIAQIEAREAIASGSLETMKKSVKKLNSYLK